MTDRFAEMTGPLGPLAVGFRDELGRLGYKDRPADAQAGLLLHLSDWLEEERLSPGKLTSTRVAEFLRARQHQGHTRLVTPKGAGPLLGYLRRVGAVPESSRPVAHEPIDQMVESYHEYLVGQRGLAPAVVVGYEAVARAFLEDVAGPDRCELARVTPGDVTNFVRRACSGRLSVRNIVSPLRSFLRFVHLQGITSVPLAGVVPSVAEWSAAGLPKALAPSEVAALMSSCDRDTALGRRDYAILALLVRLGLRAGEVAALCLEDVDWRVGEVLVHGKGRRDERLPLPADVGEAVVDYLRRGRPRTESRAVFVRALAPLRALSATGVTRVVYNACDRAGHARVGRPGWTGPSVARRCGMTDLATAVSDYLTVRRALGHKLQRAEKLLGQFVAYCDEVGATAITAEAAVAWATLPAHASRGWYGQRLSVVRRFAAWLQTLEATTVVPPADSLGPNPIRRAVPYLYTEAEITAVMDAAAHLRYPLAQCTYRTLVGLLAVSGMRVGEAIRLDRGDVSWDDGQLRVERSKFNKSRNIVLHPSSLQALRVYADRRDKLCLRPKSPSFFLSSAGTRLLYRNVCSLFGKMVRRAGLQPRSERCRPRLHDLRHSFAVGTVIDWYRAGVDVEVRLPLLSTYMGHVDPKSTYWYLSAAPELLTLAVRRLDQTRRGTSS